MTKVLRHFNVLQQVRWRREIQAVSLLSLLAFIIYFFQSGSESERTLASPFIRTRKSHVSTPHFPNITYDGKRWHPDISAENDVFSFSNIMDLTPNTTEFENLYTEKLGINPKRMTWSLFSGSLAYLKDIDKYIHVMRAQSTRRGESIPFWGPAPSFLYVELLNADLSQHKKPAVYNGQTYPRIANVYAPQVVGRNEQFGPQDARVLVDNYGNPFVLFHMRDNIGRRMWFYNLTSGKQLRLNVPTSHLHLQNEEKNWTPIVGKRHSLLMVYMYSPLIVLKCELYYGECLEIQGPNVKRDANGMAVLTGPYQQKGMPVLRGGTPFMRWKNTDYFVAFPRTTLDFIPIRNGYANRLYRPNLVVAKLNDESNSGHDPSLDLVYISQPLLGKAKDVPLAMYPQGVLPEQRENEDGKVGEELKRVRWHEFWLDTKLILPMGLVLRHRVTPVSNQKTSSSRIWRTSSQKRLDKIWTEDTDAILELSVRDWRNTAVRVHGLDRIVEAVIKWNEERGHRSGDFDEVTLKDIEANARKLLFDLVPKKYFSKEY